MTTVLFEHPAFAAHVTPEGHPEQVARMAAVARGLAGLDLDRREAPVGADADVLRCHPAAYLARLRAVAPQDGVVQLDADTWMSAGTLEAALRAKPGLHGTHLEPALSNSCPAPHSRGGEQLLRFADTK